MKKEYNIKKMILNNYDFKAPLDNNVWDIVQAQRIDYYPWDSNGYKPEAEVKLFYTESHLHIRLKAWEKIIRATFMNTNDEVYKDSCVEFFFKPNPDKDDRYFNFEMNPFGTLLLGLGKDRSTRVRITDLDTSIFNIFTTVTPENVKDYSEDSWIVEYSIPFSFIEKYFGVLNFSHGNRISGNFYKCGDDTEYPHYGAWNPIQVPAPDFHRPEFFGDLSF